MYTLETHILLARWLGNNPLVSKGCNLSVAMLVTAAAVDELYIINTVVPNFKNIKYGILVQRYNVCTAPITIFLLNAG